MTDRPRKCTRSRRPLPRSRRGPGARRADRSSVVVRVPGCCRSWQDRQAGSRAGRPAGWLAAVVCSCCLVVTLPARPSLQWCSFCQHRLGCREKGEGRLCALSVLRQAGHAGVAQIDTEQGAGGKKGDRKKKGGKEGCGPKRLLAKEVVWSSGWAAGRWRSNLWASDHSARRVVCSA